MPSLFTTLQRYSSPQLDGGAFDSNNRKSIIIRISLFSLATNSEGAKCVEKERKALLSFKQGILQDDFGMLSTWRDEDNEDCCNWKGVYCSNETGSS
ncbi:receptor-like protein EIX1 isoform X2 [Prosopis cineraria]|uniref:receptor-like protein EIX1 isoform X2 n=1 Tax=Prosopis cineraria TaxID=364024 RepID=UPI0024105DE9|nr:receptor-like protein EIX1 isoform X2 [Prosopis cineraria]